MYDDILLPVDEDTVETDAVTHAAEIAQWADATVQLLFVADTTRDSVTAVQATVLDALVERGEDVVEAAEAVLDDHAVRSDSEVVQGGPAETIVDYAEEYGYDLVVMPTHGRRGIQRYVLGSVTERVVRLSTVPVLTLRLESDVPRTFPYEGILLPTDGSDEARRAARHGAALAAALDASVHVLSVVDDAALGPDVRSAVSGSAGEEAAESAVEAVEAVAAEAGVTEVVGGVEWGRPGETIPQYADAHDLDAVVMGTTGRRGLDRVLLGSVAEQTVRSSPVPVITVGGD